MFHTDFPKAIPDERGCGQRTPGGLYVECGLSPFGSPLEHFLIDPPLPLPPGIDLVNKPQLWPRTDPASQEVVVDVEMGRPVYDLLIHIGAEHYPYAPDYIEETRRLGASRKLNPNLNLAKLSCQSRMLLAHPKAIPLSWRALLPPETCRKHLPKHDLVAYRRLGLASQDDHERVGPCLFKLWEMIPQEVAEATFPQADGESPLCLRRTGSTLYQYRPTGESESSWETGFILALPITGFALIRHADGTVNEKGKASILKGLEEQGELALPYYETNR